MIKYYFPCLISITILFLTYNIVIMNDIQRIKGDVDLILCKLHLKYDNCLFFLHVISES